MTLEQQIITLFAMVGNGLFIGFLFDGYRVVKGKIYFPKIIVIITDIGFGILAGLLAFYLLYWINHGQLRLIIPLFFIIGLLIYYFLFSKIVIRLWLIIYKIVYRIFVIINKVFLIILIKPLTYLYKLGTVTFAFLFSGIFIIGNLFKKSGIIFYEFSVVKIRKNNGKIKLNNNIKEGISTKIKKLFKK